MVRSDGTAEVQHYVPRILLRGFLCEPQEKEQVFVYDKHESRSFRTNVKNVAAEKKFYEFDVDTDQRDMESVLSELENNTKSVFDKLVEAKSLAALNDGQMQWLSIFLATQQLRTKQFREVIKFLNESHAEFIRNQGFDPREADGFELIETEADLKRASLGQFAISLGPSASILSTKACFLTTTSADRPFWISDHPVVMHNDREFGAYGNIGLAVPGIQIYLPLTSTLLLALWCTTIADELEANVRKAKREHSQLSALRVFGQNVDYKELDRQLSEWQAVIDDGEPLIDALQNGTSVAATEENVTFYNHLQVLWAHRYVMSSVDDFALAKKMISDNPKYQKSLMPKVG